MLCRTLGTGLGWFSLITCGALGNFLNIVLRDQAHHSVGFSTSIFAAVGIFSGIQILAGRPTSLKALLAPLGAGAGLLAMLGTSGERTDLGAHFFGFLCGLGFGILVNRLDISKLTGNQQLQQKLFVLTLLAVFISWVAAWQ
jgi:rhomboid protease GluP